MFCHDFWMSFPVEMGTLKNTKSNARRDGLTEAQEVSDGPILKHSSGCEIPLLLECRGFSYPKVGIIIQEEGESRTKPSSIF